MHTAIELQFCTYISENCMLAKFYMINLNKYLLKLAATSVIN